MSYCFCSNFSSGIKKKITFWVFVQKFKRQSASHMGCVHWLAWSFPELALKVHGSWQLVAFNPHHSWYKHAPELSAQWFFSCWGFCWDCRARQSFWILELIVAISGLPWCQWSTWLQCHVHLGAPALPPYYQPFPSNPLGVCPYEWLGLCGL